jgi:hypothetical protein
MMGMTFKDTHMQESKQHRQQADQHELLLHTLTSKFLPPAIILMLL